MPTTATARRLRKNQTDAESLLWSKLRNRRLVGARFKRQFRVKSYVVDFLCMDSRLVIELDGGQHSDRVEQDTRRAQEIENLGYRVLRFWNHDVMTNTEGVLTTIAAAIKNLRPR